MPDAYVTSAAITNGKITFTVRVSDFTPSEHVEISGQATQTGGAFTSFYDIQPVPDQPNGDQNDPNDKDNRYVYVTGGPTPHQFTKDEDVSVVARVARVWLTVLGGPSPGDYGGTLEGTTWNAKRVSPLDGATW